MKSLLITNVFPPQTGGSGRWFWEVYRRLPREDVLIAAGEHPEQEQFDRSHDLRLIRLPLGLRSWGIVAPRSFLAYAKLFWKLKGLVKRYKIESVHAGCCLPEGLLAYILKAWLEIPYLLYVHGEEMKIAAGSYELTWLARRVLANAKLIIANSKNTARILQQDWQVSDERLQILHPGADMERFVPAAPDPEVRVRLGWGSRSVILTVGRLQKRKGNDMLLRALPAIREAIPDVLYAMVGDGEERSALESLVAELQLQANVQFLGELADEQLVECYQQCDLFVLPNREVDGDIEGFGMVLVEAQACGKPVVAGDSGGTAETMIPESGRIVNCDALGELANAIIDLLQDPPERTAMGLAARQWVLEQFDWEAIRRQSEQLFQFGQTSAASCDTREPVAP